jgi:hypothetical protein
MRGQSRGPGAEIAVHQLANGRAQFARVAAQDRRSLVFFIDGSSAEALEGDTVLTAILTNRRHIRDFEFAAERRAGFCLMGACQDCWVRRPDGEALRACMTSIEAGMELVTTASAADAVSWRADSAALAIDRARPASQREGGLRNPVVTRGGE